MRIMSTQHGTGASSGGSVGCAGRRYPAPHVVTATRCCAAEPATGSVHGWSHGASYSPKGCL